jgi:hypothetical protein
MRSNTCNIFSESLITRPKTLHSLLSWNKNIVRTRQRFISRSFWADRLAQLLHCISASACIATGCLRPRHKTVGSNQFLWLNAYPGHMVKACAMRAAPHSMPLIICHGEPRSPCALHETRLPWNVWSLGPHRRVEHVHVHISAAKEADIIDKILSRYLFDRQKAYSSKMRSL